MTMSMSNTAHLKFGNTSQSIVPVPNSFLTNELRPMEIFNLTKKDSYFKEKTLFSKARQLNINNNQIKNFRKYDEYNTQKYIPIHKQIHIEAENIYNPHFKRNASQQTKKFFSNIQCNEDENKFVDDTLLVNNFNLFGNFKIENENEDDIKQTKYEQYLKENLKFNSTEYKTHNKERYNKNYKQFIQSTDENRKKRSTLRSIRKLEKTFHDPKVKANENEKELKANSDNDYDNEKSTKSKIQLKPLNNYVLSESIVNNQTTTNKRLNKLESDYANLEDHYRKGCNLNNSNFVYDFRLKMDNLLEKINHNRDLEQWNQTDLNAAFSKMNDTMFTPLTYYNRDNDTETTKFKYALQEKIKLLNLPIDRKEDLLAQFNKTTSYKDLLETSPRRLPTNLNSTLGYLQNSYKTNTIYPKIANLTDKNSFDNFNSENKVFYERFKPSKVNDNFPTPTIDEFNLKNAEKYSNQAKGKWKKDFLDLYKKETHQEPIGKFESTLNLCNDNFYQVLDSLKI